MGSKAGCSGGICTSRARDSIKRERNCDAPNCDRWRLKAVQVEHLTSLNHMEVPLSPAPPLNPSPLARGRLKAVQVERL